MVEPKTNDNTVSDFGSQGLCGNKLMGKLNLVVRVIVVSKFKVRLILGSEEQMWMSKHGV